MSGQSTSISRLTELLPIRSGPIEAPDPSAWGPVEERLGFVLPSDYKAFIETFGSGWIDRFLWVLNPFAASDSIRLDRSSDRQLEILRWIRSQRTEDLPYPIYPEPGGLFLWAETANGDCCYWVTSDRSPDAWQVTVNESRAPNWHDHPGPMSRLIADLLDRIVLVEFFPFNFPSDPHTFEPL